MQLLTLSQLRHHARHRLQTLLAILGVGLGVAVVNAVDIIHYSAKQHLLQTQQQLDGQASHRIVGANHVLNEKLYADLRRQFYSQYPQLVLAPVLKHSLPARDKQQPWIFLGIDPLNNSMLRQFKHSLHGHITFDFISRENAVLISAELALEKSVTAGETITLFLPDKQLSLFVAGIIDDHSGLANRQLIVMDIGNAQALFKREGELTSIDIYSQDGSQELIKKIEKKLPKNARLLITEQLVEGQLSLINALEFNLSALSFLSLIVGAFLIFSTVHFSILQRIPSFARLQIQGVTHRELHLLLGKEALCLSVLGILVGWALGYALSLILAPVSHRTLTAIYSLETSSQIIFYWPNYIKTALLGLLTTMISYYLSYKNNQQIALSHTLVRIQQELTLEKHTIRPLLIALIFFGVALLLLNSPFTHVNEDSEKHLFFSYLATCLLAASALLLIPGLLNLSYPVLLKIAKRLFGSTGLIALRDCQRQSSRVLLAVMALCLAVAATNGIAIMIDSFRHSVSLWVDSQLNADIYLRFQQTQKQSATLNKILNQLKSHTLIQCITSTRRTSTLIDNKWLPFNAIELSPCSHASLQFLHSNKIEALKN
ncbi:MAG: ABC transporter permease [Spongiibacteraceae bacterium]|nr:ABC transporter permease [Spongiibacteraceae bacterium]